MKNTRDVGTVRTEVLMAHELKINVIISRILSFICTFATLSVTLYKLLYLGIKNKRVYFVLHSIIRNFARDYNNI